MGYDDFIDVRTGRGVKGVFGEDVYPSAGIKIGGHTGTCDGKCSACGNNATSTLDWVDAEYTEEISDTLEGSSDRDDVYNPYSDQVGGNHYANEHDIAQVCIENGYGMAEGNIIKYVARHNRKGFMEDLRKAKQYLDFLAYSCYGEEL